MAIRYKQRMTTLRYPLNFLLCAVLLLQQLGCAATPKYLSHPPSEEIRSQFGSVALVPARSAPEYEFDTYATSVPAGIGKGAGQFAAVGAGDGIAIAIAIGLAFNGMLPVQYIVAFGAVGAALVAVPGSVYGGIKAVPKATSREIETTVKDALARSNMQEMMAERLLQSWPKPAPYQFDPPSGPLEASYRLLAEKGFGTILEIRVKTFGFEGGRGSDPSLAFSLTASVRMIGTKDGAELYQGDFAYKSPYRKFTVWSEQNGKLLRSEFERSFMVIAERVADEIFLLVDFPLSVWKSQRACMLKPVQPEQKYDFIHPKEPLRHSPVESLQPVFTWETFPRDRRGEAPEEALRNRITDVTYALRIWKENDGAPGELIYARDGLAGPSHRLETPLEPSTKYFWSVQTRFRLDGHERASRWAYSQIPWEVQFIAPNLITLALMAPALIDPSSVVEDPCRLNYIPYRNYYRFITPGREKTGRLSEASADTEGPMKRHD
jgi:hypothetical protein